MHPEPRGLNRRHIDRLVSKPKHETSIGSRIDFFSRHFLGHTYQPIPLIGSVDKAEVFIASLDKFDCVTYIETVLSLARASNADDFVESLRKIRYARGSIQWRRRNHYMTDWIRNNIREGVLEPIAMSSVPIIVTERMLNVVPGFEPRGTRIRCVPKRAASRLVTYLMSGDLIFFVSTRKNLDVFHAGIIVRDVKKILLRHASLSQGGVVEQELSEFLKANRMTGLIVVRPREVKQRMERRHGR